MRRQPAPGVADAMTPLRRVARGWLRRPGAAIVLGGVLVLGAASTELARSEVTAGPRPSASIACDQVIALDQHDVAAAGPGDVLCLEAGLRGELHLDGLRGTAARPIVVINHGGVVDIVAPGAYAGIQIRNSEHLRVTGTGVSASCGATVGEVDQACGIVIAASGNGITGKVRTQSTTIDHIEVGDVTSAGLGFHDKDLARSAWVQRDVAFRDLYVHDIGTEGHYHGSSSYTSGERHLLDGVEVTRNLVLRTGRDGIQVGSAPRNCRLRDNVVSDTGRRGEESHTFGIVVNRGAACDITGNRIERTPGAGIYDQGLHGQVIADNVLVDVGEAGIDVRAGDQAVDNPDTPDHPRSTHLLRNRIDGTGDHGIGLDNAAGTDNRIHGNEFARIGAADIELSAGVTASLDDSIGP
jgi:hypothetical protein